MMKKPIAALAVLAALAGASWSAGNHGDSHGKGASKTMAIGSPGDSSNVIWTETIAMLEHENGGMAFAPAYITAREGETVRLKIVNRGELEHEFVMDTHVAIMEHKAAMESAPGMTHDDPNAMRLAPGESGDIVWTFTKAGAFEFACLIPGHYDLGMKGELEVGS